MTISCGQDDHVFEDVPGFFLTPYVSHGGQDPRRGGKVISDCLFPMEYEGAKTFKGVGFQTSYREDVKARVRSSWEDMGFSTPP